MPHLLVLHKQQNRGGIISLIPDEAEHTNLTRQIYRYWAMGVDDPEMKEICSKRKDVVYETFNTALKTRKKSGLVSYSIKVPCVV